MFVLDNIDWTVKAHAMRSDNQNQSMHAVATSLVFDRVPQTDLTSADKPQQSLSKIDVMKLVPETDNDRACTKERYKDIIARMVCEFLPAFHHFKNTASNNSICKYDQAMKMQSIVVPFPVMMKDEKSMLNW